ncbi:hexose kinase [candidate division KSB1 bacterium]|nr:hexose kinase [candidate division KSB1 bacterium]
MMKIATLTINPVIDINVQIRQVVPERKLLCHSPVHQPGGGGINVTRALGKLDQPSRAIFPSGGGIGQQLEQLLEKERIEYRAVDIRGETRQNLIVNEESSGQQYRFGMPGPDVTETEWQQCLNQIENKDFVPDYLIASGSLPPGVPDDFYKKVAARAAGTNIKVIVDTKGTPLKKALEGNLYLLKPNMRELSVLTGSDIKNEAGQESAVKSILRNHSVEIIVVSLGAAGVLMATKDFTERLRAPGVPVKSRVGAGDSMVAGIVYGLVNDMPLKQAILYGVAAGTAAVMTAATDLCTKSDTERLYRSLLKEE